MTAGVNSTTAEYEVEHLARVNHWAETEGIHHVAGRSWRVWSRGDVMLRVLFSGTGGIRDAYVDDEDGSRRLRFPHRQSLVRLLTERDRDVEAARALAADRYAEYAMDQLRDEAAERGDD